VTNPNVARKPPAGTRFESGRRPDEKASIYKAAFHVLSVCVSKTLRAKRATRRRPRRGQTSSIRYNSQSPKPGQTCELKRTRRITHTQY
jgi:hypothetical protein